MAGCVKDGFGPVYALKAMRRKGRAAVAEGRGRVVLTVAPNGGRKTKADHPALPLTR